MRKPLEVFALDESMNRATGSIPYTSLIWTRRYYECGEFQMTVPSNIYDKSWAYVYADLRPETGIIQKVEYSDSSTVAGGVDTVTLSGFFMECYLNRITFLVEQPEEQKVELSPPKSVGIAPKDFPTLYKTPSGAYVYKDRQGDFIDSTGKQVDGSSDWVEVNTRVMLQHAVDGSWVTENTPVYSNFNFAVSNENQTVTIISWWGGKRTEDIVLQDDRGNTFFESGGNVYLVNGAVNLNTAREYKATMDAWNAGVEGVRYKVVTVKGPWQRTDTMEPITESDSVDQLFKWVQRFCGNSFHYIEPSIEGVVKTLDPSLQYLGDFAYKTLQEIEASYRVVYSFTNNQLFFEVWQGYDRSQEDAYEPVEAQTAEPVLMSAVAAPASAQQLPQGYSQPGEKAPWAVFSDTWGTIYGYSASRDTSNYKNTCFVLYSYDEPSEWEEDGRPVMKYGQIPPDYPWEEPTGSEGWYIPYTTKRGYQTASVNPGDEPDIETYLDLRSEGGTPTCDSDWSRSVYEGTPEDVPEGMTPAEHFEIPPMRDQYEQWPDALTQKGVQELQQNYGVITSMDTGTVNTDGYMVDFDLGDRVDFAVSSMGLAEIGRIIEAEEVYESSGSSVKTEVNITVGDQQLTVIKKAKLASK